MLSEVTPSGAVAYVYVAVLSLLLAVKGARSAEVSADVSSRGVPAEATVVAVAHQIEDIEPFGGTSLCLSPGFDDTRA